MSTLFSTPSIILSLESGSIVTLSPLLPPISTFFEDSMSALLPALISAWSKALTTLTKKTGFFKKSVLSLSQVTILFLQSGLLITSALLPVPVFILSRAAALTSSLNCSFWFESALFFESYLYAVWKAKWLSSFEKSCLYEL